MTGQALLKEIDAIISAQVNRMIDETEQIISKLLAEARAEADGLKNDAEENALRRAKNNSSIIEQDVFLQSLKHVEGKKQEIIGRVFDSVQKRLENLRMDPVLYTSILSEFIDQAVALLSPFLEEGEEVTLNIDQRDSQIVREKVAKQHHVFQIEHQYVGWGGIRMSNQAKTIQIDNTLETRFKNAKEAMTGFVLSWLESDTSSDSE